MELQREADGKGLVAVWPDGRRGRIGADALRRACRCAQCTARRAQGDPLLDAGDLAITALVPVGSYAVNIAFSDGHARGIFPWVLLRALATAADGN